MIIDHNEKPIERLMDNAFVKMKGLISADTVLGSPIVTQNGVTIIPISRVTMGFVTGGGEYGEAMEGDNPFAGGSGAGISVSPVAFLVNNNQEVKLVNVDDKSVFDKLVDAVPEVLNTIFGNKKCKEK